MLTTYLKCEVMNLDQVAGSGLHEANEPLPVQNFKGILPLRVVPKAPVCLSLVLAFPDKSCVIIFSKNIQVLECRQRKYTTQFYRGYDLAEKQN